jgi:hypothetical protein
VFTQHRTPPKDLKVLTKTPHAPSVDLKALVQNLFLPRRKRSRGSRKNRRENKNPPQKHPKPPPPQNSCTRNEPPTSQNSSSNHHCAPRMKPGHLETSPHSQSRLLGKEADLTSIGRRRLSVSFPKIGPKQSPRPRNAASGQPSPTTETRTPKTDAVIRNLPHCRVHRERILCRHPLNLKTPFSHHVA